MKATTDFYITESRSPSDNILRGFCAFFLNTGRLDPMLLALDGTVEFRTNDTPTVGIAIWRKIRKDVAPMFRDWIVSNPVVEFVCNNKDVHERIRDMLQSNEKYQTDPLSTMVGQRFKDLTDFDRKRMPKDVQKSFETKAHRLIERFIIEYRENPRDFPAHKWFDIAMDPSDSRYLPHTSLRSLHSLLCRYVRVGEDMSLSIRRVRDEFQVASVMLS